MQVSLSDWHNRASGLIEVRPTLRVLLLDVDDNTLLFCGQAKNGSQFWFTPDGEIEPGEAIYEAAHRELYEEIGLTNVCLEVEVWRRVQCGIFRDECGSFVNGDSWPTFRSSSRISPGSVSSNVTPSSKTGGGHLPSSSPAASDLFLLTSPFAWKQSCATARLTSQ